MEEQQQRQPKRPRTRREFTKEFKRDAVELVRATGRPIAHIARDLGTDWSASDGDPFDDDR